MTVIELLRDEERRAFRALAEAKWPAVSGEEWAALREEWKRASRLLRLEVAARAQFFEVTP